MAIYAKFDSVIGKVTTDGHTQWCELDSLQWGYSVGAHSGTAKSAEATLSNVTVTMKSEAASIDLAGIGLNRTVLKTVKIDLTTTTVGGVASYMSYSLVNAMINHYAVAGGHDGAPVETFGLSFQKITITVTARDSKLSGTPKSVTYDLTAAATS